MTKLIQFPTEVSQLFDMRANLIQALPYGNGHINDTFCASYDQSGQRVRYIHQRINHNIFKNPPQLMDNIRRVTEHALRQLQSEGNLEARRRTLTTIPGPDGKPYAVDSAGNTWRTYPFIERTRAFDRITSPSQAEAAAAGFGEFQKLAATLPGERLFETIPDFHHTAKRYERLQQAVAADTHNRAAEVQAELAFAVARAADCGHIVNLLANGEIPERITHNDTKLNNVLLDDVSGEATCVIDLDTVMPGCVLYDFGDMVRTATPSIVEDSTDLNQLQMQMPLFEALLRGYLRTSAQFLNDAEIDNLAFSGKLLSLECGIRFLTDYLEGDHYFKTHHAGHNLERCRNQFALVASIEKQLPAMEALVRKLLPQYR